MSEKAYPESPEQKASKEFTKNRLTYLLSLGGDVVNPGIVNNGITVGGMLQDASPDVVADTLAREIPNTTTATGTEIAAWLAGVAAGMVKASTDPTEETREYSRPEPTIEIGGDE